MPSPPENLCIRAEDAKVEHFCCMIALILLPSLLRKTCLAVKFGIAPYRGPGRH